MKFKGADIKCEFTDINNPWFIFLYPCKDVESNTNPQSTHSLCLKANYQAGVYKLKSWIHLMMQAHIWCRIDIENEDRPVMQRPK